MIDKLYDLALKKEVSQFAWTLYSGVNTKSVSMKDLLQLIKKLGNSEIQFYNNDETDEWAFHKQDEILSSCAAFAFCVLKKGILDGAWSVIDDTVSDGETSISFSEIREFFPVDSSKWYDPNSWYQTRLDEIEHFEPEKECFLLAPLDHITESNALVILTLLEGISEAKMYTAESLKEGQYIWPEQLTHEDFNRKLSESNHTQFMYFFLDNATFEELSAESEARFRTEDASSVAEAVLAATELDFQLSQRLTFPYTAYMLITGQLQDVSFLTERPSVVFEADENLSEEDQHLLKCAVSGDAIAQDALSKKYLSGMYPDENGERALHWVRLAADQGVADAQANYGVALQNGLGGIEVNNTEAIEWFKKAAKNGSAIAMLNIGLAYAAGRGVYRDIPTADMWFRKAADNGNEMAKIILKNGLIINS